MSHFFSFSPPVIKRAKFTHTPLWRKRWAQLPIIGAIAIFSMGSVLPSTTLAATIKGTAFMDMNNNGTFDSCEPPQASATIFIRDNALANAGQGGFYTPITDANGHYSSISHNAGSFTIWADIPWGQKQTAPVAGEGMVMYDFTIANSSDTVTIDFGIFDPNTKNTAPTITTANATSTANPIRVGDVVDFAATITDPDACDTHTYSWDFGDGSTANTLNAKHTYSAKGTYTVTLTVTDKGGLSAETTLTVEVLGAPPVVQLGDDIALDVGEAFDFTGTFTDADGRPRYDYVWKFGDGNTSVGRRWKTTRSITATHAFLESGEFTVTLEVTDKDGNTGSTTMTVNVRGNNTDACATGVATVRSRSPWAFWSMPTAWNTGKVPGPNDWVLIQGGHTVVLPTSVSSTANRLQVRGICIAETGTLQSAFNTLTTAPSVTNLYVTSLHNKGTIKGANGINASPVNGSYKRATAGSRTIIYAYKFINATTGIVGGYLGARGGDDLPYKYLAHKSRWNTKGGAGGQIEIYPNHITNLGLIEGGRGGNAYNNSYAKGHGANGYVDGHERRLVCKGFLWLRRCYWVGVPGVRYVIGTTYGGNGGLVRVFSTNLGMSSNAGKFKGGCGGNAYGKRKTSSSVVNERTYHGKGGNVYVNVGTNSGKTNGCRGSVAYWDPTTLKTTSTTVIEGTDQVIIFGGEDWTMDLRELSEGAISATDTITIAVGKGGIVDLPDASTGKVFQAGTQIEIFADTIRMGGNVLAPEEAANALQALVDAPNITVHPHKILYRVELSHADHLAGEPNETIPVTLTILNGGPAEDTYTVSMTDSAGWNIEPLPETITVNSMRRSELVFDVPLPEQRGEENLITVTVTSQNDDQVQQVAEIRVSVLEEEVITPRGDEKADITFVIEDTQTMGGDILMAANAVEKVLLGDQLNTAQESEEAQPQTVEVTQEELDQINADIETNIAEQEGLEPPTIELLTFKDDVTTRVVTNNVGEILGRMRSIQPSGGDDCPNASVAAIESALENINPNGQIFLITASPPHKDAATAIAKAQENGIKVHLILTGSCGNETVDKAIYQRIADETDGTFSWLPKGIIPMADIEVATITIIKEGLENLIDDGNENDDTGGGENGDAGDSGDNNTPIYRASGTIVDDTRNPMADVTIQIENRTTTTDENGNWEITELPEGEYTVIAHKEGYPLAPSDCALGNDEDCQVTFVKADTVLTVNTVANPRKPQQGENVTYTVTVMNGGEQTATGVEFSDILPENVELLSIEALDGGDCDATTVTCSLPDLTTGNSARVKLVISNNQGNRLENRAKVISNEYPVDVHEKRTSVTPHLAVTMSCTPKQVAVQGTLHCSALVELSSLAPSDATGVELVMIAPDNVKLQSFNTDDGICDTSEWPIVTCSLTDLSVDSANATSTALVEMKNLVIDPGLLVLKHDAQVSANEYGIYKHRARNTIFVDGIKVDQAFVIDVTGSMQGEINGVIKALNDAIHVIKDSGNTPLIGLVTFRDEDEVELQALTSDLEALAEVISKLKASGGGTCHEASAEAINLVIPHVKDGGSILFATDASAYPEADVNAIIEQLRAKSISFNGMITGDCNDGKSWN